VKNSIVAALTISSAVAGSALLSAQFLAPQGPPVDPSAQFEAASIKGFDNSGSGPVRLMMTPGRLEANGVPMRLLLRQALRVQDYQILNLPDWVNNERYTIVAKMPEGAPPTASPVMLTNLFKDRFKLAMHNETREMPIFNLVLARQDGKLGPSLKPTSAECQTQIEARRGGPPPAGAGRPGGPGGPGGPGAAGAAGRGPGGPPPMDLSQPAPCGSIGIGPGMAVAGGQPPAQIVQFLAQFTGRPVYDKTGLTGFYDFNLRFAPEPGAGGPLGPPPPGAPPPPVDPDAPNIYTAVQEQLGLKLESAKGPVDVVVIDRIERPTLD
jgi:uncharacterized protein (TIGR03435 family)